MDYCAASDLYSFGLPRGAAPNPGRLALGADASANTIELGAHGFATNDPVSFRAEAGGSLPAPLVEGVTYFAIAVNESAFSVSAAISGAAINLTTAGESIVVIAPLAGSIASAITWASRVIDDMLPAHMVPLVAPIHELVKMTCAELAAGKLLQGKGSASKSLTEMVDAAGKRLARWATGVPLRGANVPPSASLASIGASARADTRGWSRFGGIS